MSPDSIEHTSGEEESPRKDFAGVKVDANLYSEHHRNTEKVNKKNETVQTKTQIFAQAAAMLSDVYGRLVSSAIERTAHVRERALANNRDYVPNAIDDSVTADLVEQMSDFEGTLNAIIDNVFRLEDLQKGVLKITTLYPKIWDAFWDEVQDHPDFALNHPLFKTDRWKDGMRVSGSYVDGHLAQMSVPGMDRYRRNRRGVLDELKKPAEPHESIENNVDLRFREVASKVVAKNLDVRSKVSFDRLRWNAVQEGNDTLGFSHFIEVTRPAEYIRGEEVPYSGGRGLVMIDSDIDNPKDAAMAFIDYDYVDKITALANDNSFFKPIFTKEGYFNAKEIEDIAIVLADERNTDASERTWNFYARDSVAHIVNHFSRIEPVIRAMKDKFFTELDLQNMQEKSIDDTDNATLVKVKNLIDSSSDIDPIKEVLSTYCSVYVDNYGPDWWIHLNDKLETL